jgi:two-component system OmpR family response regulator
VPKHILVVDDEARIREVVTYALRKEGYAVSEAADGRAAIAKAAEGAVDLLVLDVMLPEIDGLEVCRRIRGAQSTARTPILFLSARSEEVDRVVGLELGGDDYLVKPFSPRELVARVRALFRRVEPGGEPVSAPKATVVHGPITLDVERHEVTCGGSLVGLTATEFGLLGALLERPGVVLSRAQLMQRAYKYDNLITERTIDTHVRRVRAKFRPFEVDPIVTVHGVGYKASELAPERERR